MCCPPAARRGHDDADTWQKTLTRLDRLWFAPLEAALKSGRVTRLEIVSTTAYGIYGDKIAGGYGAFGPDGEAGFEHGYIYDRVTDTFTTHDHPGSIVTHL